MNMQTASEEKQTEVILKAKDRTILGKRTRSLRKEGITPGNIFGPKFESKSISFNSVEFLHVYRKVRESGLMYIDLDGKSYPCLISEIQIHPVSDKILHANFKKVNLKQKTQAEVPFIFINESPAVKQHNGELITQMTTMTVEALPAKIPQNIEVDLSKLVEIGDVICVKDLPEIKDLSYMDEPETVIVSVTAHIEESVEPDVTATVPDVETESTETTDGEATADTSTNETENK